MGALHPRYLGGTGAIIAGSWQQVYLPLFLTVQDFARLVHGVSNAYGSGAARETTYRAPRFVDVAARLVFKHGCQGH